MKKQGAAVLIAITFAFAAFTAGFFLGRSQAPQAITVSVPAAMQTVPPETTVPETEAAEPEPTISFPIDINTAGQEEFMALPGIGEVLAQRILRYREETGSFSRLEDLLNVEGIGQKRFEDILDLIAIGG